MKAKLIEAVGKLKWWQMFILFPSIFMVLLGFVKESYDFVYHDVMGNPVLSVMEKRNLSEFKRHFQEEPVRMETLGVDSSSVEVAYYESDSCMLVTRRMENGNTNMIWLPLAEKKLVTYTKIEDSLFTKLVYAADFTPVASAHDGDLFYIDTNIGWVSPYEFIVERRFSDGCTGRYKVWAPTGAACCWVWVVDKH